MGLARLREVGEGMTRKAASAVETARGQREELSALKSRVQRLERAIQTDRPRTAKVNRAKVGRHWDSDTRAARSAAISAYYDLQHREWLQKNPQVVERMQETRDKLNKYLRKKGFEPEPEIEI